jgi:hypothetical protein
VHQVVLRCASTLMCPLSTPLVSTVVVNRPATEQLSSADLLGYCNWLTGQSIHQNQPPAWKLGTTRTSLGTPRTRRAAGPTAKRPAHGLLVIVAKIIRWRIPRPRNAVLPQAQAPPCSDCSLRVLPPVLHPRHFSPPPPPQLGESFGHDCRV